VSDFEFHYPRYLQSKLSVDRRSINRRVEADFLSDLSAVEADPIHVLEVGGGTGGTLRRLLSRLRAVGDDISQLVYTLVDRRPDNVHVAERTLRVWADEVGYVWTENGSDHLLRAKDPSLPSEVRLSLITADFFDFLAENEREYDAIVAQAVFDILDQRRAVRTLSAHLRPGGLWYLPIHFDGTTGLEPLSETGLDSEIERIYHDSMRNPHSGRRLLTLLRRQESKLQSVGSSDWIVFGSGNKYPNKEDYFLKCIMHFIKNEIAASELEQDPKYKDWLRERERQIRRGDLILIAHQIDIYASK